MTAVAKLQEIGSVVDNFKLPEIVSGGELGLSSFLNGKRGAVVLFWSGVCSHCARYDQYFNSFESRHPDLGFVALASRQGETRQQIRKTIGERKLAFPILHDSGGAVAKQWSTQQTPRAFLIAADRGLLYRGAIDNFKYPDDSVHVAYLEPAITEFLSGQPITRAETASFGCAIQSVYYLLPIKL
jgi:peroxiredoxin